MNRNYVIIAVAILVLVLVSSMMRSGSEEGANEESAPAADTETEPAATE